MSEAVLTVTEAANAKLENLKAAGRLGGSALRVSVSEDGAAYHYQIEVVGEESRAADDEVVESRAVPLYIDPESAGRLRGATLDFVDSMSGSGFKFENPNKTALLSSPIAARVQQVLDDEINPGVAGHGGQVSLVDVQGERVVLRFGGGCQGCGMANATLKHGVESALRRAIPEITEVLDATDHAAGDNPYY